MSRLSSSIGPWLGAAAPAAFGALLLFAGAPRTESPERVRPLLEQRFSGTIRPFLQEYCVSCHGKTRPQAQLDLAAYGTLDAVTADYARWSLAADKVAAKQMPPAGASRQPTAAQREQVVHWIRDVRAYEAARSAGDPGPVLARRLSNAEYDYTIRDLTGVDLRPTREFPVDPANQEGFDNSGESLTVSPALMKKYLQAARDIADHAVFTSTGIEFATHPVLAETDRDKFCILRIVDFYKKQPTDYASYFLAAWRYKHRAALGKPNATLQTVAAESSVSPRYLETIWNTLTAAPDRVGPIATLHTLWNALPAPAPGQADAAKAGCEAMRDWVLSLRKKVAAHFDNIRVPRGFSDGGQVFVLWKDREYASHRRMLNADTLQIGGVPSTKVIPARRNRPEQTVTAPVDPDLFAPKAEAEQKPYLDSFNRFCSVFPDAFYISERGRMFVDDPGDKGRLLTAGLHNSMGYFRDDTPLMELVLDDAGRKRLDSLWQDFDMVAFVPERMHIEFFHYERAESGTIMSPEFDFVRAEDKDATSDAKIKRFADAYAAKAKASLEKYGGDPVTLQAIDEHFKRVSQNIRAAERARLAAEPVHLKALHDFAQRAYRRPLTPAERSGLVTFYRSLRQTEDLNHEEAVRDTIVSVLMSPNFLYRLDLMPETAEPASRPRRQAADAGSAPGSGGVRLSAFGQSRTQSRRTGPASTRASESRPGGAPPAPLQAEPLPDYALASRLSYFIWSSLPDAELMAHAAAGDLHRPEVLAAQARRMIKDQRTNALALEFGGNWLDFRRFQEHNAVDRERFPQFTDTLRESMFEEPQKLLMDTFQNDRSLLDLVFGNATFVNGPLARHYGMADIKAGDSDWVRVENADRYGRGGLLPMGVFLTENSPGLRTSPVKRGYWVVRRLLGEVIPPPPAVVPELPKDEGKLGDRTLRQALEQHRANPACAGCHARFDSYGLVFEGYGPIGESRTRDLGGKPIDAKAPFPGGDERTGLSGLKEFVREKRQQDFVDNFCRKLLSYALGRTLQLSDDSMLAEMRSHLASDGYRFGGLVETIVTSRQFRYRRASITLAKD